jgi:hypothetical protein
VAMNETTPSASAAMENTTASEAPTRELIKPHAFPVEWRHIGR